MATRTTNGDVKAAFERLCKALGKSTDAIRTDADGKTRFNVGAWVLDGNPTYGGFVVEEIDNESGGVGNPLGSMRMGGAEFVRAVRFATDALDIERKNKADLVDICLAVAKLNEGQGRMNLCEVAGMARAALKSNGIVE